MGYGGFKSGYSGASVHWRVCIRGYEGVGVGCMRGYRGFQTAAGRLLRGLRGWYQQIGCSFSCPVATAMR